MRVLAFREHPHHHLRGEHALLLVLGLVFAPGCDFLHGALTATGDAPPSDAASIADTTIERDGSSPDTPSTDAFVGVVRRINIAGTAYTGIDHPGLWSADLGVCTGGTKLAVNTPINATDDDVLFQTAVAATNMHCTIGGLPTGAYEVTLLLAEIDCSPPPSTRMFSVALEGTVVAPALDLVAEGGGCALAGGTGYPIERTYAVALVDGALNLDLAAVSGAPPLLNAIQVIQTSGP